MKYALIIPDGAADLPLEELDGRTPMEAARTPNLDRIATMGKVGSVRNVPEGFRPGSDVAIMSLIGYDPRDNYTGRAPLEAAAKGLEVGPEQWVLRCNFVTIVDELMQDYCAGHISSEEAAVLIAELNEHLSTDTLRFYPGVGYRHLMLTDEDLKVETTPPHDIPGEPIEKHLPTGRGSDLLKDLMARSRAVLEAHEVNTVRTDLGENPANSIWLWGEGKMPRMQAFAERFGVNAAVITAVDLVRGLAELTGIERIDVEGATGYIDTNYAGKGMAAVKALAKHDLVIVHVEAPDECGHNNMPEAKTKSIEDIDKHVVGPVLARLQEEGDDWRILILPDHPTPCSVRTHTRTPVPFALAGKDVTSVLHERLTEAAGAESDLHIEFGHELMEYFLKI